MTAKDVYENSVRSLSASEQLKLAALIMNELKSHTIIDFRDEWSDEDMREATLHSFERAAQTFEEEA
jgi:hypothetical protein